MLKSLCLVLKSLCLVLKSLCQSSCSSLGEEAGRSWSRQGLLLEAGIWGSSCRGLSVDALQKCLWMFPEGNEAPELLWRVAHCWGEKGKSGKPCAPLSVQGQASAWGTGAGMQDGRLEQVRTASTRHLRSQINVRKSSVCSSGSGNVCADHTVLLGGSV